MKTLKAGWLVFASAVLFTLLFYKQALGINLLIYESLVLAWLFFERAIQIKNNLHLLGFSSVVLTVIFTVLHHSTLSFFVNFLSFFIFVGSLAAPEIRSIPYAVMNSFSTFVISQGLFPKEISFKSKRTSRFSFKFRRLRIFLLPLVIILVFISIYSASNPKFGAYFSWFFDQLGQFFITILDYLEINAIIVLILGIMFGSFFFIRRKNQNAIDRDAAHSDQLFRKKERKKTVFRLLSLVNEYRAAVFLFISLNALLLFLNIMDISYVWFNFKWEGQYLKDFVHQGTYLLLVSILVSMILVLYFFRKNLNFYQKNSLLKKLSYVWIFQNAILVFSVGIRNWYYIQYYALAYKRIAIVFFLLLCLFALFTVFLKISKVRSAYFMIRTNFNALMIVLVISSAFNWDRIIAQYNFSKSNSSFVHLNYLATLADSALPYLDHPLEKVRTMDQRQMERFSKGGSFGSSDESSLSGSFSYYKRVYLDPLEYVNTINYRKAVFKQKWEAKSWLGWNLAEAEAYHLLTNH
jgi:hypothetical protein